MHSFIHGFRFFILLFIFMVAQPAASQSLQDQLYAKVIAGTKCEQTANNGLHCEYKIGDRLSFSIKDVGGSDTVVGFNQSNINEMFYAVLYFGCVVVVPGHAHVRNYDKNYGVSISIANGRVYKTQKECQIAK